MSFWQELSSWSFPIFSGHSQTAEVPKVGSNAPALGKIEFPRPDNKAVLVCFLRHCGCPFAEKTFNLLRTIAEIHPEVQCVAVSHSNQAATDNWLESVGARNEVEVIVDDERQVYGKYGLGFSSFWAVLNPWSLSKVYETGKSDNIWNRPTESGSRWQTSGVFAISSQGTVKYSHVAASADDLGNIDVAVKALRNA